MTAEAKPAIADDIRHKIGCPEEATRVEQFYAYRPQKQGGHKLLITRCQDCGEATYEQMEE